MFERRTAVEPDTRDTGNDEFDCQHVALPAGREVTGRTVDGAHRAVGKGLCVEPGSSLGVFIVPEANRVLCDRMSVRFHCTFLHFADSGLQRAAEGAVPRAGRVPITARRNWSPWMLFVDRKS